jgi:hypothetical protein
VIKKKAPPTLRQGTRASTRLKVQNKTPIHEPAPIEPEVEQTKRKREADDDDMDVDVAEDATEAATTDLSKKQAKLPDDQADAQKQAENSPVSRAARVDPASDEEEGASEDDAEESAEAREYQRSLVAPPDDGYIRRCYLQKDDQGRVSICLGLFRPDEYYAMQAAQSESAES